MRGQLTERDHLDALRIVKRRLPFRWAAPALFLGGPAVMVVMTVLGGMSLQHAVIWNMFWIVVGGIGHNDDTVSFPPTHEQLYPDLDTAINPRGTNPP